MSSLQINGQISWVYTHDLDSTAEFYACLPGLDCVRDEGRARIFATAENAFIGVCEAFDDRVVEPKGGMISLLTDDVDDCYRQLIASGVAVEGPPHRLAQFGIYTFFLRDPNGYRIEFQQFV